MNDLHDRRAFLRAVAAASAAWAAADFVQVEEALAWAAQQPAAAKAGFTVLTAGQAAAIDAMAARILPAVDGRPGAHEAGVVYFVDRALATFQAQETQLFADGVADLNRRAAGLAPAAAGFAALTPAQQDTVLHEIETTPFFQSARVAVLVGAFALPEWGGNRDFAGWHILGFDHQPAFQPPFGFYDADVNRRG